MGDCKLVCRLIMLRLREYTMLELDELYFVDQSQTSGRQGERGIRGQGPPNNSCPRASQTKVTALCASL